MVSHSGRGECGAAEWQQSNSVGDPADQSVYSVDTFSRRCEGLGFSSDRIYCPPCPRLLSTVFQSACSVINVLKLHTHTHTHWPETASRNGREELNLRRMFLVSDGGKMPEKAKKEVFERVHQETMTQVKSPGDSRKQETTFLLVPIHPRSGPQPNTRPHL